MNPQPGPSLTNEPISPLSPAAMGDGVGDWRLVYVFGTVRGGADNRPEEGQPSESFEYLRPFDIDTEGGIDVRDKELLPMINGRLGADPGVRVSVLKFVYLITQDYL